MFGWALPGWHMTRKPVTGRSVRGLTCAGLLEEVGGAGDYDQPILAAELRLA